MDLLLVALVGIPAAWHLAAAAGTYWDAGRVGMDRWKWTAVVLAVPLFGLFGYLFERSERRSEGDGSPYARGRYNFHDGDGETVPDVGDGGDGATDSRAGNRP